MPSRRLPSAFTPNELTALLETKRRSGASILDLTETNPTRAGLSRIGPEELRALADPQGAAYEPDPRGALAAREAIARYYAERASAQPPEVTAEDLLLVSSTSEAYAHLIRFLCDPGDEILIPRPSYPLFEPIASLADVRVERYRLAYHEGWRLDLDSVEAALSPRTRAVVVVQPNNPTGSCLSSEEILALDALCAERGIALVSDEVFGDFPWPPERAPLRSLAGERRAATFVLNGISKLCGMPQMKVAWILLQGPVRERRAAARSLEWIADLFLSVSTPVQVALPMLLEARHPFGTAVRGRLEENLACVRNAGPGLGVGTGEGGWSAVVEAGSPCVADLALEALAKRNVLVHPGYFYDLPSESQVVVSLLTEPRIFREGIGRLESLA